ncbi:hypothetical protein [uncultured Clostridium sp.]|uniref:hypothetical protein n=1 Tax=uncultured Clostridium sp. TaxID=59620 RepID=UPI0028E626A9|nr:hypothetical protein [uncultured Clostridium sp.]
MKKFISIFSIFLLLSLNINTIDTFAQSKSFTQGFYTMNDLGLNENTPYSVQNLSPSNQGIVIIIDKNRIIQQILRLTPSSPKHNLGFLENSYHFIIYGDDIQIVFS